MDDRIGALHDAVRAARGTATIRSGSAVTPRRCARSWRVADGWNRWGGTPDAVRGRRRARARGGARRDDHVGRSRADRRRRRGRARRRPQTALGRRRRARRRSGAPRRPARRVRRAGRGMGDPRPDRLVEPRQRRSSAKSGGSSTSKRRARRRALCVPDGVSRRPQTRPARSVHLQRPGDMSRFRQTGSPGVRTLQRPPEPDTARIHAARCANRPDRCICTERARDFAAVRRRVCRSWHYDRVSPRHREVRAATNVSLEDASQPRIARCSSCFWRAWRFRARRLGIDNEPRPRLPEADCRDAAGT